MPMYDYDGPHAFESINLLLVVNNNRNVWRLIETSNLPYFPEKTTARLRS
jgi:hypothetical protein